MLRKKELKRLEEDLSDKEYKELKGVMWLLRKKEEDVTEEDAQVLDKLFKYSPLLKQVYSFRNELTFIFNMESLKRHAKQKINGWIKRVKSSGVRCFDKFFGDVGDV